MSAIYSHFISILLSDFISFYTKFADFIGFAVDFIFEAVGYALDPDTFPQSPARNPCDLGGCT